jgi:hypothetical protein
MNAPHPDANLLRICAELLDLIAADEALQREWGALLGMDGAIDPRSPEMAAMLVTIGARLLAPPSALLLTRLHAILNPPPAGHLGGLVKQILAAVIQECRT